MKDGISLFIQNSVAGRLHQFTDAGNELIMNAFIIFMLQTPASMLR